MKKIISTYFMLLSCASAFAQTTLFEDHFGAPPSNLTNPTDNAAVRKIWPYMPTGFNTFIFADPSAPDLPGTNDTEQAKKIENNFYAVVGPKYIYTSVNFDPSYKIWEGLVSTGDHTEGHNGNGGALVINAGTTLSSFYVRFADLQAGKYYKLSYYLYVENETVKLDHKIISTSGNTTAAIYESPNNGQNTGTDTWKLQEYWFYMPAGCESGTYSIAMVNANAADDGNDFAIDDLKFEEYNTKPENVTIPESANINCNIAEPIAVNDVTKPDCNSVVTISNFAANDSFNNSAIDFNKFGAELMVPMGAKYTSSSWSGEWIGGTIDLQTITVAGEGIWKLSESRTATWNASTNSIDYNYSDLKITFTPNSNFTGNPTPIPYRLVSRDGSAGNSNMATVSIFYTCNPSAIDDDKEVSAIVPGTAIPINILDNDVPAGQSSGPVKASDVSNVSLFNPYTGVNSGSTLTIVGEGTWTYNSSTGELTFTPESGFTGTPTPIQYQFTTSDGKTSNKATVSITVTPASSNIVAADDSFTIRGGDSSTGSILDNDTLNGAPVTASDVTITQNSTTNTGVNIDPVSGKVNVAVGTPDGTYTISYTITDADGNHSTATVTVTVGPEENYCYNPANTSDAGLPTQHGITLQKRAGANTADQWPMSRNSAYTVLESNTKGFVITRISTENLNKIEKPEEGMMVFDTTEKCLKIYDGTQWSCFNKPACP